MPTCYSPVRRCTYPLAGTFSLDLHVLGTPPAFVLSQDQTLRVNYILSCERPRSNPSLADGAGIARVSTHKPVAMIFYCQRTEVAGRDTSRHKKSRTYRLAGQGLIDVFYGSAELTFYPNTYPLSRNFFMSFPNLLQPRIGLRKCFANLECRSTLSRVCRNIGSILLRPAATRAGGPRRRLARALGGCQR